jgi:hypothetical protein
MNHHPGKNLVFAFDMVAAPTILDHFPFFPILSGAYQLRAVCSGHKLDTRI